MEWLCSTLADDSTDAHSSESTTKSTKLKLTVIPQFKLGVVVIDGSKYRLCYI